MKYKLSAIKLSLIFLTLIVVGCKKDDNSMYGKWVVTTHIYTSYQNNVKTSEVNYSYKSDEYVLVINFDGTGKFIEFGQWDYPFTWEKINDKKFSLVMKPDRFHTDKAEVEIVVKKNTLIWTDTYIHDTSKIQNYIVGKM